MHAAHVDSNANIALHFLQSSDIICKTVVLQYDEHNTFIHTGVA